MNKSGPIPLSWITQLVIGQTINVSSIIVPYRKQKALVCHHKNKLSRVFKLFHLIKRFLKVQIIINDQITSIGKTEWLLMIMTVIKACLVNYFKDF